MRSEARESGAAPEANCEARMGILGSAALVPLGAGPPGPGLPPATHLAQARWAIDRLAVRKEKTRGNLALEEAARLDELLAMLRLRHVEVRGRA